jgi:hypothetical protein
VSVAVDGVATFSANATIPDSVLVGFTAACGGLNDRHAVSNVSISTDDLGAAVAHWQPNGKAVATSTGFQLTDTTGGAVGSVFWTAPVASSSLTVAFDASISGGTGADGLTLTLADPSAAGPTALGTGGGGLGFSGIQGIAVALDTYKGTGNPSANFVGISNGAGTKKDSLHWLATSTSAPPLRTATRHVVATVAGGTLSVTVDGAAVVSAAVTLPPNVLVGFTAANGGLTDRHAVDNMHVTGVQ